MPPIRSLQDAQRVWQRFNAKYTDLTKGISTKRKRLYEESKTPADLEKNQGSYQKAAFMIQRAWNRKRAADAFITINPKGNHTGNFNHLLNPQATQKVVKKSINKVKLEALYKAVQIGDWTHEIFKDPTLPQLALSLYASDKISQQQLYTLLEYAQTAVDFPLKGVYRILDEHNDFTLEAKQILLPVIQKRFYLEEMSASQVEDFRLLIASLPVSEQVFYTNELGKLEHEKNDGKSTGRRVISIDGLYLKDEDSLVNLACGARDALGIARFGLEEYVRPMPRLGKIKLDDIEHGMRHFARYASIHYPDTIPYEDGDIHGYIGVLGLEALGHDIYHSHAISVSRKNHMLCFLRLVDVARQATGFKWSKEIWEWVDQDYVALFHYKEKFNLETINNYSIELMTDLFMEVLTYGQGKGNIALSGGFLIKDERLTCLGALIFIDMITNREAWLDLYIDPEAIIDEPFKTNYDAIKNIYSLIKNDKPEIQVLKSFIYLSWKGDKEMERLFYQFNDMINECSHSDLFSKELKFTKLKREDVSQARAIEFVNTIGLSFSKDKIILPQTKPLDSAIENLLSNFCKVTYTDVSVNKLQKLETYLKYSLLVLDYDFSEAKQYTNYCKQGYSDYTAQFKVRPSFGAWLKANPIKSLFLSLTIVGIMIVGLYGHFATKRQKQEQKLLSKENQEKKTTELALESDERRLVIKDSEDSPLFLEKKSPPTNYKKWRELRSQQYEEKRAREIVGSDDKLESALPTPIKM
ncbi:hypothetical protein ACQUW5_04535 [Legionella sp. CNM-1927-20]|uniref:hypothetical protein n=1 Tax=Legionella sp. CNM-1927-20 TaxID=3422221 RepID=UPI00403B35BB